MEEEQKGPFGGALPISYYVQLWKVSPGKWSLIYTETVPPDLTDDEIKTWSKVFNETFGVQPEIEGHQVTIRLEGSRSALAGALMFEFMGATTLGKLTLAEIMAMAGMYAKQSLNRIKPVLDKAQELVERMT